MATDTPNTGRDSDKFMLRFPDGMRDRLKEAAKANNRTMNAEIVARLEGSFDAVDSISQARLEAGIEASMLREEVARLVGLLHAAPSPSNIPVSITSGTSFAPSVLMQLAGQLHDQQNKRNTLALVVNALQHGKADAEKIKEAQLELQNTDKKIQQLLSSMYQ